MNVQKRNGVSIYCLSSGPAIPDWMNYSDRQRRNLIKNNDNIRRRIELIQDFNMPISSSKIVQSLDGQYIVVTGTYPPRTRCYDTNELAMKYERYVNGDIVDIVLLGTDYGKQALLCNDRNIIFHAHYGTHETIRVPHFGRAIAYEATTCDLLVVTNSSQIYRFNLDEGRYQQPWNMSPDTNSNSDTESVAGVSICNHPHHALNAVGCTDGVVRFWDSRTISDSSSILHTPFLKLNVISKIHNAFGDSSPSHQQSDLYGTQDTSKEITSIAFDSSGMYMGVGTGAGYVALYDIRSSNPLYIQEHKDASSIHTIKFHNQSNMILSSDEKLIKVWRYKASSSLLASSMSTKDDDDDYGSNKSNFMSSLHNSNEIGSVKVNIEGNGKITNFIVAGDTTDPTGNNSGLLLCTTDQPNMDSFYIPALGVAPKWCSYLDNITEELEEKDLKRNVDGTNDDIFNSNGQYETVFEKYKFVTRDELETLGISNLIGTPMLRGYMNGFFMDIQLYTRVRSVVNPFEYEQYQKQKLQQRLASKQSSWIAPKNNETIANKKKPKVAVNPDLVDRLTNKANANTKTTTKMESKIAKGLLSDNRFGSLFTNPDFEIDYDDTDFKLRNPSGISTKHTTTQRNNNFDSDDENDDDDDDDDDDNSKNELDDKELDDVVDNVEDNDYVDDYSESESEEEDGFRGGKVRGEAYDDVKRLERKLQEQQLQKKSNNKEPSRKAMNTASKTYTNKAVPATTSKLKRPLKLYEDDVDDGMNNNATLAIGFGLGNASKQEQAQRRRMEMNVPIAQRTSTESAANTVKPKIRVVNNHGSKEAIYYPKSTSSTSRSRKK